MENIGKFLDFRDTLGVPKTDTFQTVDLYEGQNIPQVSWYSSFHGTVPGVSIISYKRPLKV